MKRHRHRVIRHLEALSVRLNPAQERLAGKLTDSAPSRKLHIPLICALTKHLSYPDTSLMADLARGMPIVGDIPLKATLPTKETPATMSLHDVRGAVRVTNQKVLKSLEKSTKLLLKQKCWDLSRGEFRKRVAFGTFSGDKHGLGGSNPLTEVLHIGTSRHSGTEVPPDRRPYKIQRQ